MRSRRATKFEKKFWRLLNLTQWVIFQIFVTFSENLKSSAVVHCPGSRLKLIFFWTLRVFPFFMDKINIHSVNCSDKIEKKYYQGGFESSYFLFIQFSAPYPKPVKMNGKWIFTKYLSVATETRIASSPTRTFSPSDLCFEEGWIVHQHASPSDCSCKPTSKASLSLLVLVDKQAKYWNQIQFSLISKYVISYPSLNYISLKEKNLQAHIES